MRIKDIIKKINWNRLLIGLALGSLGGFAYYYFVGCQSGTCPIQSNPTSMTLYGAGMGAVLFFSNKKSKTKPEE